MTQNWLTTPITPALLRGFIELEQTERGVLPHRLPGWARAQCSDPQLAMAESEPAGVRIAFRSRTTLIEVDTVPTRFVYVGVPARPAGLYDLHIDGGLAGQASAGDADTVTFDMATGSVTKQKGEISTLRFTDLPDHDKAIEIWLPYGEITQLVEVRTNAPVEPFPDRGRKVWLHHGSSISKGSNTDSPSTSWPVLAAAQGEVELINLGFSGSALLDPFTARVIRDTPADLISLKIGINLVNTDLMRMRAFTSAVHGFVDVIREGRPTVPILLVSPLYCPIHEDTPGPGAFDLDALAAGKIAFRATGNPADRAQGKLTLVSIRDELQRIARQRMAGDPHLHYLDGLSLYGPADFADLPLPDALHPDAAAHRRIGERFAAFAFTDGGPFCPA
ncbi:GDSL-type esterase/lipase family protein [Mesorhizobium sp. PAMC28654]|uniref:GDSL-type esterase/lipase family protein n=1 Tax=Mesorhizobium sp. PAMC28654 TaxID=2880934 RepID=UPI001D0B9C19|nr:GDSL-type esterase/lipase family protein [Mesorhizobium sp. PAMC28654]UDL89374.1 GDSL-type esterase/lipase family protein [Mesorhizobium sp. PAMC28654]